MRAFLALPPDPAWTESARGLVAGLQPRLPPASWTRPEAWHLTLKFLGEIPADAAAAFAYRSELLPAGAAHTAVREWELETSGAEVRA